MNWLDQQVSLYSCLADNTGRPATLKEVLFSEFAVNHDWFFRDHDSERWINGNFNDLDTIIDLRTHEVSKKEKSMLKATMQCFTPAGLLKSKKKGCIEEISRTGLMQLDFDYEAIQDYDIEELKQAVFALPFVAFCSLSCSGNGFYALVAIEEPHRLQDYAEHCFYVLKERGLPPDTSKGRNVNDLRFVSYDCNMLIRENPEPLKIKQFRTKAAFSKSFTPTRYNPESGSKVVDKALREVAAAVVGTRWQTVQKWAYTLGGFDDPGLLNQLQDTIKNSSSFGGEEAEFLKCAADCFAAGTSKLLQAS